MRRALILLVTVGLAVSAAAPAAEADHSQVSVMQDDQYLIYSSPATVAHTLGIFRALGVEQIRVNVLWSAIAPDAGSRTMPPNFNPTDPASYPASNWAPYDRLAQLAPLYGMQVEFNLTAPGPLWAMGPHPPTARAANHWKPNPLQFFQFVYAVGKRYSGAAYGQPRVSLWSIWNEPNQPGWLAPQSGRIRGREVAESPRLYRALVDYAYYGLYFSGHLGDTILIGETAPEGYDHKSGFYTAMTPMPFLRDLYCVDRRGRPLGGSAAKAEACPTTASHRRQFAANHPLLFRATGYAHHPYYFFHPPGYSAPDRNFVPLANLGRLGRFLDGTFRHYGVRRRIPIYFTEYGYQTRPPDPYEVVTPAQQATYLNQADYMAWRNPRVRSVAQFLLFDSPPDRRYRPGQFGYWDTFQTGLLFANGRAKPALSAYQVPVWVPRPHVARPGGRLLVWGQVRPADQLGSQRVAVEWRPAAGGRYHVLAYARTAAYTGYLTARVRVPGTGYLKLTWRVPSGGVLHSRAAPVTAG